MKIALAIATLLVCSTTCFAASEEVVSKEAFGCSDQNYFLRAVDFAKANDTVAFEKFLRAGIMDGKCVKLNPQTKVFLEDFTTTGIVCIRPVGETVCYWTAMTVIQ